MSITGDSAPGNNGDTLRSYWIWDSPPVAAFDDLASLAARLCDAPMALISFLDGQQRWFTSRSGFKLAATAAEWTFRAKTMAGTKVLVVPDAWADARFADNSLVTGDPYVRFFAGAQLTTFTGLTLGVLCVMDRIPRQLDAKHRESLLIVSRQVTMQLEFRRVVEELANTIKLLDETTLEQKELINQYRRTLSEIKTLRGLLPICSACKKIRNARGDWTRLEEYIREHSHADFTHGLCPDCVTHVSSPAVGHEPPAQGLSHETSAR